MRSGVDGAGRGDQRLADHLAAEDALPAVLGAATAEEVVLERLEVEDARAGSRWRPASASSLGSALRRGRGTSSERDGEVKRRELGDGAPGSEPDILIAGGGSAGLTAALAIARSAPDLGVEVIDAKPPGGGRRDERASAIAAAARRMLEQLGIWPRLEAEAQPILSMEITDSRTRRCRCGRSSSPSTAACRRASPSRTWCRTSRSLAALRDAARGGRHRAHRAGIGASASAANGRMRDRPRLRRRRGRRALLVAADGIRSRLRALAGIKTVTWSYPQTAIVATVRHERPHNGVAVEHFLPGGPFAILPLKGNRSSLVWTERKDDAREADGERRFRLPGRAGAALRPSARRDRARGRARAPIRSG